MDVHRMSTFTYGMAPALLNQRVLCLCALLSVFSLVNTCPTIFLKNGGSCYDVEVRTGTVGNGVAFCQERAGHLLYLETEEEIVWSKDLYNTYQQTYWLGATVSGLGSDNNKWLDGTPMIATSWRPNFPDQQLLESDNATCVSVIFKWENSVCNQQRQIYCEFSKELLQPLGVGIPEDDPERATLDVTSTDARHVLDCGRLGYSEENPHLCPYGGWMPDSGDSNNLFTVLFNETMVITALEAKSGQEGNDTFGAINFYLGFELNNKWYYREDGSTPSFNMDWLNPGPSFFYLKNPPLTRLVEFEIDDFERYMVFSVELYGLGRKNYAYNGIATMSGQQQGTDLAKYAVDGLFSLTDECTMVFGLQEVWWQVVMEHAIVVSGVAISTNGDTINFAGAEVTVINSFANGVTDIQHCGVIVPSENSPNQVVTRCVSVPRGNTVRISQTGSPAGYPELSLCEVFVYGSVEEEQVIDVTDAITTTQQQQQPVATQTQEPEQIYVTTTIQQGLNTLRDILAEVRGFTDETDVDTIHDALTGALAVTLSEDYQMKLEGFDHVTEIIDLLALTCAKEDNIAESFVEVCSSVLDEKNENILKSQDISRTENSIMNSLENFGMEFAKVHPHTTLITKNLELRIGSVANRDDWLIITAGDHTSAVNWPTQMGNPNLLLVSVVYQTLHKTLSNKLEDTDNATFSFGSHVTSLTLLQYNQKVELNDDFSITLGVKNQQIQTSVSGRSNRSCVFWKYGEGDSAGVWSRDGCWVNDSISNSTYTFCHCNHLTNFAVLMQVVDVEVPPAFNEVMQYITIIGSALSIICLLATIVTYAALRLKSRRIIIHSNLAVALMIAQTLFLLSGEFTNNQDVCGIIAITLHYFFMATFCWLLMEAVHLYLKTVSFTAKEIKNVVYVSLGWGLPVIIVSVSVGVKRVGYGSQDSCWLSTEGGLIWAFVGPALAILMINTGVLVVVMHAFMKLKAIAEKTNRDKIKSGLRAALVMQPLLGLTWIFGVFSVNAQTAFFQFLFVTLNSIQGVVMFIFHCLLNDEVKKALQLKKQKLASSAEYSTSMTTNLSTSKSKKTLTSVAPSGNSEQEISDTQQMNGDKERPKTGGKTAWQ